MDPFATQWFQLWTEIPFVGRQWAGWLSSSLVAAVGLQESLTASAATGAGVKWVVLTADGQALPSFIPPGGLGNIPGLNLPGGFGF